jgi:hypothetical protein
MERLKNRKTESQSRNKVVSMIELYEKYVDEPIETIRIWSSTRYLVNDKWNVDIQTNKVDRSYPDPDW